MIIGLAPYLHAGQVRGQGAGGDGGLGHSWAWLIKLSPLHILCFIVRSFIIYWEKLYFLDFLWMQDLLHREFESKSNFIL